MPRKYIEIALNQQLAQASFNEAGADAPEIP